jgi:hypothetical protein
MPEGIEYPEEQLPELLDYPELHFLEGFPSKQIEQQPFCNTSEELNIQSKTQEVTN